MTRRRSNSLMVSLALALILTTIPTIKGNDDPSVCNLCADHDPNTPLTYPPGEETTCTDLADKASQLTSSSSAECLAIQEEAIFCGCTPPPQSCSLCHDGAAPSKLDALPNLPGYIAAGIFSSATDRSIIDITCRDLWKELASKHEKGSTECVSSQTLAADVCGCDFSGATAASSPCTLCADGSFPTDPGARITLPGDGGRVNCTTLHDVIAPSIVTTATDCSNLRRVGTNLCGCPDISNPCPLCKNGVSLPNPGLEVQPDITCQRISRTAAVDERSHCPAYQMTAGVYCECEEVIEYPNVCRICRGDKLLPDPKIKVFNDRGEISNCMRVEMEANVRGDFFTNLTCEEYQDRYEIQCGCVEVEATESPTPAPPKSSAGKLSLFGMEIYQRSMVAIFLGVGFVWMG